MATAIDVDEFLGIKKKIEKARIEKARAEGARNKIVSQLKEEFDLDIDDVPAKIKELEKKNAADLEKAGTIFKQLSEMADWEKL